MRTTFSFKSFKGDPYDVIVVGPVVQRNVTNDGVCSQGDFKSGSTIVAWGTENRNPNSFILGQGEWGFPGYIGMMMKDPTYEPGDLVSTYDAVAGWLMLGGTESPLKGVPEKCLSLDKASSQIRDAQRRDETNGHGVAGYRELPPRSTTGNGVTTLVIPPDATSRMTALGLFGRSGQGLIRPILAEFPLDPPSVTSGSGTPTFAGTWAGDLVASTGNSTMKDPWRWMVTLTCDQAAGTCRATGEYKLGQQQIPIDEVLKIDGSALVASTPSKCDGLAGATSNYTLITSSILVARFTSSTNADDCGADHGDITVSGELTRI